MTDLQVWEEDCWSERAWVRGSVTNSTAVGVESGYWQSRLLFVHWKQAGRAWSHLTCYLILAQCALECSILPTLLSRQLIQAVAGRLRRTLSDEIEGAGE